MNKTLQIGLTHLDLGLGGAERLVVSAACALQNCGHSVILYTTRHYAHYSFPATNDGTLNVKVYGSWIPRHIFGRFVILLSTIRMMYLALVIFFSGDTFDVILNDQLPIVNWILKLRASHIVYYCHYPDFLLCQDRSGLLMKAYRFIFDTLEAQSAGNCSLLLTNSYYTAETYRKAFPQHRNVALGVLYPPVDFRNFKECQIAKSGMFVFKENCNVNYFLSISRYDNKKMLEIAIYAFHYLMNNIRGERYFNYKLILAGAYDAGIPANVEYFSKIKRIISDHELSSYVILLCNISDDERKSLLEDCLALIYTPRFEHFGIVPCEAMAVGSLVIASNTGGPRESVIHGKTGFLCDDNVEHFAAAMDKIIYLKEFNYYKYQQMKRNAKEWAKMNFSADIFQEKLNKLVSELCECSLIGK